MKNYLFEIFTDDVVDIKQKFITLLVESRFKHTPLLLEIISTVPLTDSFIIELFSLMSFYKGGKIANITMGSNGFKVIEKELSPREMLSIYEPTVYLGNIHSDNVVILESELIVLGNCSGTIMFKMKEAKLIAHEIIEAKIVHPQGIFYPFNKKEALLSFRGEIYE